MESCLSPQGLISFDPISAELQGVHGARPELVLRRQDEPSSLEPFLPSHSTSKLADLTFIKRIDPRAWHVWHGAQ